MKESVAAALGTMVPRIWTISLDFSVSPAILEIDGSGCRVHNEGGRLTVKWDNCGHWHTFLVVDTNEAYLTAMGGQVCPIYARRLGAKIFLSNVASRLMRAGETIKIDAFVLLQNLSGIPFPQNNIFKDIQLLEASAEYQLSVVGLKRLRSILEGADVLRPDDVLDIAIAAWDLHLSSGSDIAVLLSGGYDSRLNLAIACNAARRYRNRVHAFHEHKSPQEESIAIAVAAAANVPLTIQSKHSFVGFDRAVVLDEQFIDLQSGYYRDNLIRWHKYLAYIKTVLPDCVVMGLGAEAHKGKFYSQISTIDRDAAKVFSVDKIMVRAIARKLGLRDGYNDSQQSYFNDLTLQARSFNEHSAQVDYIHYQTYIANGYGHRCHDLQQYFGIPFPMLDNSFLAAVFALPRNDKEGFALVTRGIERFAPNLSGIPYISANEKALKPAVNKSVTNAVRGLIGPRYYDWFAPRRRGRTKVTPAEHEILNSIRSKSSLNTLLTRRTLQGIEEIPFIRLDYMIETCLYLNLLEKELAVICTLEGYGA